MKSGSSVVGELPRAGLSIVLPAYLEEENLRLLLPRIKSVLGTLPMVSEVLVVDTQIPMDGTVEVARHAGAVAVPRKGGNSYGDAVRTGITRSTGDWVIFMDADGSHPPEWIAKLLNASENQDLIIASRYVQDGFTENSRSLVIMSRVLNWTYSLFLGIRVKDVSNSFRLYRGQQLRALSLSCDHFDIVEEILIKLVRNNRDIKIREIAFTFKKRMFGDSKRNLLTFMLGYVFTLFKLKFLLEIGENLPRFCAVGIFGALVNLVIFSVSERSLAMSLNLSAVLGFVVSAAQNYLLNRAWTFRDVAHNADDRTIAWIRYLGVNAVCLCINLLALNCVVRLSGAKFDLLGQVCGILAGMVSNFALARHYVFSPNPTVDRQDPLAQRVA